MQSTSGRLANFQTKLVVPLAANASPLGGHALERGIMKNCYSCAWFAFIGCPRDVDKNVGCSMWEQAEVPHPHAIRPTKRAADSPKAGAKSAVSRVRKSKVIRPAKSG